MFKPFAITSLAAAAFVATAVVAATPFNPAEAQVTITFGAPPPAAPYEAVPAPRPGHVWSPGHYRLVNDRYVWTPGRWLEARPGYRYVPDAWERYQADGRERWRYVPSRWDRDGDGIPNSVDRYDNRQGALGDRDRDGIPNAFDPRNDRR
ncbi:MAG: YXWGXW repeat-containing protein [Pseudomonadota bacterium]